jgi:hypothetical protein
MMPFDALRTARANGSSIRVIYNAGSQPGSVREIIPVVVADKEISAIDVLTGIKKTFKIEFLALPPVSCNAPQYDPSLGKTESEFDTKTIEEVSRIIVDDMRSLGWHIVVDKDEVGLFAYFKNGKPKKTPEVRLNYQQFVTEFVMDDGGELHEETALSNRPYRLESKNFASARSFAKLSSAWPKFLDEAWSRAPHELT